jgi:hypothetical protein
MVQFWMAVLFLGLTLSVTASAQSVEVDDEAPSKPAASSEAGSKKADQYFKTRKSTAAKPAAAPTEEASSTQPPHYMAIHFGTFFSDEHYNWAQGSNNLHNLNAGVTYRLGEWVNSMDFAIRVEYTNYAFDYYSAKEISIVPIITFPDASSHFPLYVGGGVGLGLFTQQVPERSPVALDWQIFGGVRVLNIWDKVGVMVESGMKNHVLIGSPGQFNGVFVNVGAVFVF